MAWKKNFIVTVDLLSWKHPQAWAIPRHMMILAETVVPSWSLLLFFWIKRILLLSFSTAFASYCGMKAYYIFLLDMHFLKPMKLMDFSPRITLSCLRILLVFAKEQSSQCFSGIWFGCLVLMMWCWSKAEMPYFRWTSAK